MMPEVSLPARLSRGECLLGATLLIPSPQLAEMVGHAGFDCLMIDQEHTQVSGETLETLVRAADAVNLPAIVRVPQNTPESIRTALDLGATGIVVPHVATHEAARMAVQATRYPPEGIRGVCPNVRAAAYGGVAWSTYHAALPGQTAVIPIIEDPLGVRNIDEILQVEGLTAVLLGSVDLAAALGVPGEIEHPLVRQAMETVADRARAHGLPIAMVVYDWREFGGLETWVKDGVRLFLLSLTGSIVRMLREARSLACLSHRCG